MNITPICIIWQFEWHFCVKNKTPLTANWKDWIAFGFFFIIFVAANMMVKPKTRCHCNHLDEDRKKKPDGYYPSDTVYSFFVVIIRAFAIFFLSRRIAITSFLNIQLFTRDKKRKSTKPTNVNRISKASSWLSCCHWCETACSNKFFRLQFTNSYDKWQHESSAYTCHTC